MSQRLQTRETLSQLYVLSRCKSVPHVIGCDKQRNILSNAYVQQYALHRVLDVITAHQIL
jgi:hypothetical protein